MLTGSGVSEAFPLGGKKKEGEKEGKREKYRARGRQ